MHVYFGWILNSEIQWNLSKADSIGAKENCPFYCTDVRFIENIFSKKHSLLVQKHLLHQILPLERFDLSTKNIRGFFLEQ